MVCEEKKSGDGYNRRLHWTIGGLERVDRRCAIEILGRRYQSADGVKSTRDACNAIDGRKTGRINREVYAGHLQRDRREKDGKLTAYLEIVR